MKDYYQILNVSKNASEGEIKKAYRRLAHKYHPDRGGDEKKFKEVNEAYQVLSNREKKAQYDRFGRVFEEGAGGGPTGFNFGGNPFGFSGQGKSQSWDFEEMGDFGDVFETLFDTFGGGRRRTYTQGSDMQAVKEITLEEVFRGRRESFNIGTYITCNTCGGLGHEKKEDLETCKSCDGKGEVRVERRTFFGKFSQVKDCSQCGGRGQIPKNKCRNCEGKGRVYGSKKVEVEIPPGIEDNQVIKITGAGEAGEFGNPSGDLYVTIKVTSHPTFRRKRENLYLDKEITLSQAFLGKDVKIKDIDGHDFEVSIPSGFNFSEKLKVPGRGMTVFNNPKVRGDLHIGFIIKRPKKLSRKAEKLLEELDKEL